MPTRRFMIAGMLLLVFFSGRALPQPRDDADDAGAPATIPTAQQQTQTEAVQPATASPAGPETAPADSDNTAQRSPYDYRSSEEISEDRSVSFPTDI